VGGWEVSLDQLEFEVCEVEFEVCEVEVEEWEGAASQLQSSNGVPREMG